MACDLVKLATPGVAGLHPYLPGKPVQELERELGIKNIIKLASNENPLGPGEKAKQAISSFSELSRYPDGNAQDSADGQPDRCGSGMRPRLCRQCGPGRS